VVFVSIALTYRGTEYWSSTTRRLASARKNNGLYCPKFSIRSLDNVVDLYIKTLYSLKKPKPLYKTPNHFFGFLSVCVSRYLYTRLAFITPVATVNIRNNIIPILLIRQPLIRFLTPRKRRLRIRKIGKLYRVSIPPSPFSLPLSQLSNLLVYIP
jgi:hypothetical protein